MSASSPYMSHAQAPQSGYRLRPVRLDSTTQPASVSPSPPPPPVYSPDAPTSSSAHMPPHSMQTQPQDQHGLPPLVLSPTNPNAPPRPWSPSAGVREIDAAPPPRRVGLPAPPTGHDLMALFPARSPSAPATYATAPNPASGSGAPSPGANVPIPTPTSGWFIQEERRFFAREGKEIIRLKREEALGIGPSGNNSGGTASGSGSSTVGTKRERETDREREMVGVKRSPPISHAGPSTLPPATSTSYHSSSPPAPSHYSHSRSASTSQPQPLPQQPFLTLVQSNQPFRQPLPPPPRDREPARNRESGRDVDGDMHMQSAGAPSMNTIPQRPPFVAPPPAAHQNPVHSSPVPPPPVQQPQHQVHGHTRGPSYGAPPPPSQQQQQYTYSHTPPPSTHSHPQPPPPHTRGAYTHPPPPPPAQRSSPSYSVQPPPHHEPVLPPPAPQSQSQPIHPTYSAVPPHPTQHPSYTHHPQNYSVSPPQPQSAYPPDTQVRDSERERAERERGRERGREAYPSPSPSREGYPSNVVHSNGAYPEGYSGGSAYLAASERRRAGKHTRRVVVKA